MEWKADHASDLSCVWLTAKTPVGDYTIENVGKGGKVSYNVVYSASEGEAHLDFTVATGLKTVNEAIAAVEIDYQEYISIMLEWLQEMKDFATAEGWKIPTLAEAVAAKKPAKKSIKKATKKSTKRKRN